jgi:hypothetical protein
MDDLSNFVLITNHLWPPCLVFLSPFHPTNSAIWLSFLNSVCKCCICQVWKTLLPIFCLALPLPPESAETVAALSTADPVYFEAMAAEQNCCAEMQRLLGGSSLQLAFRQAGTQHLAGDVSTGIFRPIVPQKFRKDIFSHFHNISHLGRLASRLMVSSRFIWRGLATDINA